jgi:hypothetical protein
LITASRPWQTSPVNVSYLSLVQERSGALSILVICGSFNNTRFTSLENFG